MQRSGSCLLDTGVLVALLYTDDGMHGAASEWIATCRSRLHTVEPVLTETAFFLPPSRRALVADLAASGMLEIHRPDGAAYKRAAAILRKYADVEPDWADAMLVWAAEETGIHNIATFDVRDFSTYRIHGRSKFVLEKIA